MLIPVREDRLMLTYSLSVVFKSIAEKPSQAIIIAEGYISKKMVFLIKVAIEVRD